MCGIAGLVHRRDRQADVLDVARMLAPIGHRGPDDCRVWAHGRVGLGHVRLSIIDLAGGRQPLANEDRSVWVTFNGEIFNYVELRESLEAKGHRFATRSDTEVIVHAYEEYGPACVEHFNGQWGLALWDQRRGRLLLSRDRLGVRPLYYTEVAGKLLFASEVKALFADPDVPRQIDPVGLDQVFTVWCTIPPRTVFEGICELPPGCNLTLENGTTRVERYWHLDYEPDESLADQPAAEERLRELLADAARLRLRSDVPVGAYVSGGLDSAVTAAMVRRCSNAPLRTFSITFDQAEFDESRYQREVVEFLGTDHQSFHCRTLDIGKVFPDVVWHAERPVVRTAPAPLYLLARLVEREGFKVVVTGEGADETLGGYDLFKEAKVRRFWAAQPESEFRARLLGRLYPYLPGLQAQSPAYRQAFFRIRPEDLADPLFSHLPRWELTARLKSFFSPELRAAVADHDVLGECRAGLPAEFARWHPFCRAQYLETAMLLPGYILSAQGDRMSMAHAVEGRFPFLDHRLVEFAARLPWRLKMKGLNEKYLLKRAAAGLVPPSVIARSKQPYRAPDGLCFLPDEKRRGDLAYVDELLSAERIAEAGLFRPQAVTQLVRKFRQGRAIGMKDNMALVAILSTQLLVERFFCTFPRPPKGTALPYVAGETANFLAHEMDTLTL